MVKPNCCPGWIFSKKIPVWIQYADCSCPPLLSALGNRAFNDSLEICYLAKQEMIILYFGLLTDFYRWNSGKTSTDQILIEAVQRGIEKLNFFQN